jgi:O-antigen/teichoic acid export membrane protein
MTLGSRAILGEGAWVVAGQIGAALGALAGIRLLTEFLEPGVYGLAVLLLGIAAFGQNLVVTPFMQAVLRFHPESVQAGTPGRLRAVAGRTMRYIVASSAVAASLIGVLYGAATHQPIWLGLLVAGVFCVDSIRSFEVTLLNAARRQRTMALCLATDAWLKPLAAIVTIVIFDADAASVLLGYIAGSAVLLLLFYRVVEPEGTVQGGIPTNGPDPDALRRRLWVYATPLLLIAVAGWVSSIGDRYLLAGMLGLREAGIYAAVYALVGQPFLMMSGVAELTVRPVYYHALAVQDRARARVALRGWLVFSLVVGGMGLILIWLLKDMIVSLLLAEPYHVGADLMPWIAAGYWLLAVSHVYTRVCYAHDDTKAVLWIEVTGALLAMVVAIPAILSFGLVGAAIAVPIYFGGQLGVAVILARRAERPRPATVAGG